jgi:hypothetical protein
MQPGLPVGRCEKIIPNVRSPQGNVMGMTCGFRGMRSPCAYVAALVVRHLQLHEGGIRLVTTWRSRLVNGIAFLPFLPSS